MKFVRAIRNATATDCVAAVHVAGCAIALTALLGLVASAALLVVLLPLAVLATLDPALTFGGVPSTAYPTAYLAVQAAWTLLVGLGVVVAARTVSLPAPATDGTSHAHDYAPTRADERLAGLVETVAGED